MSLQPLKPLSLETISSINSITESNNLTNPIKISEDESKILQNMLLTLENKLRTEFQQQIDRLSKSISQNNLNIKSDVCPSNVNWDSNVERCRSPDGKFVKSECCDMTSNKPSVNEKVETNKIEPPSYYITSLMNKYKGQYVLASEFHNEVNKILNEVGIPHLSPQQIRIFVNLNGYSIVKMNGQNTYKFLC